MLENTCKQVMLFAQRLGDSSAECLTCACSWAAKQIQSEARLELFTHFTQTGRLVSAFVGLISVVQKLNQKRKRKIDKKKTAKSVGDLSLSPCEKKLLECVLHSSGLRGLLSVKVKKRQRHPTVSPLSTGITKQELETFPRDRWSLKMADLVGWGRTRM